MEFLTVFEALFAQKINEGLYKIWDVQAFKKEGLDID